jgi:hypothetical protein
MRHPGPSTLPSRLYGLCREPGRRGRSNRNREKRAVSSDQSDTSVRAAPSVSSLKKIGGASLGGVVALSTSIISSVSEFLASGLGAFVIRSVRVSGKSYRTLRYVWTYEP